MKPQIFTRHGQTITDLRSNQSIQFSSLNKAKAESHKLQMKHDEALGRGTLRRQP